MPNTNTTNTTIINIKQNSALFEHFAIEVISNPLSNCVTYLQDILPCGDYIATPSLNDAIKFQSINTATQFNSIISGRIISFFNDTNNYNDISRTDYIDGRIISLFEHSNNNNQSYEVE